MAVQTSEKEKGTVMELLIKDRLTIQEFFPERGTKLDQLIALEIKGKIDFTAREREDIKLELKMTPDGRGFTWKWDPGKDSKIYRTTFSKPEISFLKKRSSELDRDAKLTIQMVETADKIDNVKVD